MAVLLIAVQTADADRVVYRTRCEVLSRALQVFVGRVDAVATASPTELVVTFTVLDALRGTLATPVVHMVSTQGASCAPLVVPGEELLVVANGGFASCANARRRADAADDLGFLRGFAKRSTGYLAGTVVVYDNPYESMTSTPRAGVEIRVPHTAFSTRTAADGSYRLEVPPGRYAVELVEPDATLALSYVQPDSSRLEVYQRECTLRDFGEAWNGRIRGRLVDHTGKPAGSVRVHAIEASRPMPLGGQAFRYGPNTLTDFDGYYELGPVPAGKYVVAVSVPFDPRTPIPGTFYPGVATRAAARSVVLGRGELVAGIDFQLRAPRPMAEVTVKVSGASAHRSIVVRLTNPGEQRITETEASGGGESTLREAVGARVILQACFADRPATCGRAVPFVVEAAGRRISLEAP